MADQIVYIAASDYDKVIDPAGATKSSLIAKKIKDQFTMPYGIPVIGSSEDSPKGGMYGRVVETITTPGINGKTLFAILNFPKDLKSSIVFPVHIIVIEKSKVKEVLSDPLLISALQGNQTETYLRKNSYNEALDAIFPDLYSWSSSELIIKFPEIYIRNSKGQQHTLYDLYVMLGFSSDFKKFIALPKGRRLCLTKEELATGYRHSHLHSHANSWDSFCLGNTAFADQATTFVTSPIDADFFMVFLHQLDDYVAWESVEGGPYIRLENSVLKVNTKGGSSQGANQGEGLYFPSRLEDSQIIYNCASSILCVLSPEQIICEILHTGERRWVLDTDQTGVFELIRRCYSGSTFRFDILTMEYEGERGSSEFEYDQNKRAFLQGSLVFKGQVLRPTIIGEEKSPEENTKIINVPAPIALMQIVETVNQLLNTNVDIYK